MPDFLKCPECGFDDTQCRCSDDWENEPAWCTWCGGDGWDDECHEEGCYCLEGHPCAACGGSGLAKDQRIW